MTDVERIKYMCRKTVEAGDNCIATIAFSAREQYASLSLSPACGKLTM